MSYFGTLAICVYIRLRTYDNEADNVSSIVLLSLAFRFWMLHPYSCSCLVTKVGKVHRSIRSLLAKIASHAPDTRTYLVDRLLQPY
jgi:hypothetical protein